MCSREVDLQLCAFEAAFPFLKAALEGEALEREIAGFRADLMLLSADPAERREIEQRLLAAMHSSQGARQDRA